MDREHLRTGDRALCHFRFIKNPEFIQIGTKMIFREGRTKAVGSITKLFNHIPGQSSHNTRTGKSHKAQMHHRAQQANRTRTVPKKVEPTTQKDSSVAEVKDKQVTNASNATTKSTALRTAEQ